MGGSESLVSYFFLLCLPIQAGITLGPLPIVVVAIVVTVGMPITPSIVVTMMVTWTMSDVKTNLDVVPMFSMPFCKCTAWGYEHECREE